MKLGQPQPESNLAPRVEQERATAGAVVVAGFVVEFERAGEGALGALFAEDVVLLGGELGAPFGFGFNDFAGGVGHVLWSVIRGSWFVIRDSWLDFRSDFGDDVDFYQDVHGQAGGLDGGARGRGYAFGCEVARVHGIHGGEIVHVL